MSRVGFMARFLLVLGGVLFAHCSGGSTLGKLCGIDEECGPNVVCDEGRCRSGSTASANNNSVANSNDNSGNENTNKTDPPKQVCPSSCQTSADCESCSGGRRTCIQQNGESICGIPGATACFTSEDCNQGESCVEKQCRPSSNNTAGCRLNSDCAQDESCVQGECQKTPPRRCRYDRECSNGQRCLRGACQTISRTGPSPCRSNADCVNACPSGSKGCACTNTRFGQQCLPTCQQSADCPRVGSRWLQCYQGACR